MTEALPLPLLERTWGFVVGRIIQAVADTTADLDRLPEAKASKGTITFDPLEKLHRTSTAFVWVDKVTATLGPTGELVDAEGQPGIWLISGAYNVRFAIGSTSIPPFVIHVTPEHTIEAPLDLVSASPN